MDFSVRFGHAKADQVLLMELIGGLTAIATGLLIATEQDPAAVLRDLGLQAARAVLP